MELFSPGHLFMVLLIILVVFGAGKVPTIARDLGKGIREFKKAMNSNFDDDEEDMPVKKTVKKASKKKA
jgi:sec-independent protein translocase protein TatA